MPENSWVVPSLVNFSVGPVALEVVDEESVDLGRGVGHEELVEVDRVDDGDATRGQRPVVHLDSRHLVGLGQEMGGPVRFRERGINLK